MLAHWTEQYVNVGDSRFHIVRTGDGSKPALVLAHGFSDNGLCWTALAQELEADWDVILPDARGHGFSQRVAAPDAVIDLAADLAGIIEALGLHQPVVGGHSMGASTAALLGARYPHQVSALILEDPAWFNPQQKRGGPTAENPDGDPYEEWRSHLVGATADELIAQCRQTDPTWREVELRPWADAKLQIDPNFVRASGRMALWGRWQEVVRDIHQTTLLITASPEKGSIITPETAQTAAGLCPTLQIANIPGVGHCIRREAPDAYTKLVREFLSHRLHTAAA